MAVIREIKENLKTISSLKTITRTYQEIANLRMNKIRQGVLNNREFIEELSRVYTLAKRAYISQLKKKGVKKEEEFLIKQGKERVIVFLSGNQRFYGTLILDIWRDLLNYLATKKGVLVVVGRRGKYLAERSGFGHKMTYFELDDDRPEKWRIKEIIEFIRNYGEVIIFHGRFQTILSQKVVQSNISRAIIPEKELAEIKTYLFEPSAKVVLEFFETELMSAFLNQVILEHQLARYASRMVAMHQATENAEERKRKLEMERKKLENQLFNKKQIELFSGFQLWD